MWRGRGPGLVLTRNPRFLVPRGPPNLHYFEKAGQVSLLYFFSRVPSLVLVLALAELYGKLIRAPTPNSQPWMIWENPHGNFQPVKARLGYIHLAQHRFSQSLKSTTQYDDLKQKEEEGGVNYRGFRNAFALLSLFRAMTSISLP